MPFRSLRSKIFLLVVALLVAVAAFVMLTSQRNVTRTVMNSERHAVSNVMELVLRDAEARWGALLTDKISTVRNGRRQLMQTGTVVAAALNSYADLAERGILTQGAAKGMARAWINRLKFDDRRYAFVYDADFQVLASGNPEMIDRDLSELSDFKNRPLAQALYEESRTSGYGFAIYRWPPSAQRGDSETRYAYFGYFRPWNWVFAITDSAHDVIEQIQTRREQMESSVRATLSKLTLAQSGFIFIASDDGRMIVPLPEKQAGLLDAANPQGETLRGLLARQKGGGELQSLSFDGGGGPWRIDSARFAPLGWTLVAAVPESDLTAPARELLNRQALIFLGMMLVALICAWLMAARIVRPLETLTRYARLLPEQDLTAASSVPAHIAALPDKHKDEVGRLAASFLFMDHKLRENVARLMRETTARERFESELNIARAIQLGLLPVPLSSAIREQVDLNAVMLPAKEVGGDLYDYFTLPDGRLCLAIGDVSDKGVPAALFMAVTRTLIRATAEDETDPARMMQKINNRLSENNPNMMFVTLLLGVLDLTTGELQWANAGHLPPAVVGADGTLRLLEGRSGPACGVQEDLEYRSLSTVLAPGEMLVGYTDGVTEAVNPNDAQYGDPRLLAVLSNPPVASASLAKRLLEDVQAFADGAEQSDDITLIVIRRP
ncbi:SpoIIE family protein phosphatase [Achromobacter deleyi]|uniref:SpoIIE family protein phosphatase n=1 Tax=Achromobacter deleyi TaxID=1353891 RepID=UPI00149213BB|nr:SpoIIE family protein phosphatase [Achromobacter deleyi]QVQ24844.1 SpoIIE family protein phosphatase [Achromobacter deleyi]UIP20384.1 SpoIIE family protein phosphatase [Achromobacter deleyi]